MNIKCGFVCFTRHCTPGPCPGILGPRSYSGLDSVSLAFWKAAFRALPLGGSQSLILIPTFCTEILLLMGWTKKVKSYFSFKILEFSGSISGTIEQFSTWKSSQHFVWERVSACGKGLLLSPPQDLKTRMCNVHICRHKTIVQGCVFVTAIPGCTQPASLSLLNAKLCICSIIMVTFCSLATNWWNDSLARSRGQVMWWAGHLYGYKASDCSAVKKDWSIWNYWTGRKWTKAEVSGSVPCG